MTTPDGPPPDSTGRSAIARFDNAFLLLAVTSLMWAGNTVAGRLAIDQISPMVLITGRWALACMVLALFHSPFDRKEWGLLWPRWRSVTAMGMAGFTGFNALFYVGAYSTSAVNMGIIQGSIPVMVMVAGVVLFGMRIRLAQWIGVSAALAGVIVTATHGDIGRLIALGFNFGDLLLFLASVLYAGYAIGLRNRPAVSGLTFFWALAVVALITSLPLLAIEIALGQTYWPTLEGFGVLIYVALFPSLLAQVFFIRGVALIGPARAGLFVNLVPVFSAALGVLVLGEPFHPYHVLALALVLGGIYIAERQRSAV